MTLKFTKPRTVSRRKGSIEPIENHREVNHLSEFRQRQRRAHVERIAAISGDRLIDDHVPDLGILDRETCDLDHVIVHDHRGSDHVAHAETTGGK